MSPDEDERMERAERIRKLREEGSGRLDRSRNGDTDEESGDDATAATASGATGAELPDPEQMEAALADATGATEVDAAGTTEADATEATEAGGTDAGSDGDTTVDVGLSAPAESTPAAGGGSAHGVTTATATTTTARARVLEFALGDELYCIDIAGVEEIVKRETVTRVPNTPEYVEGVVDLRGQITTILDAKHLLDVDVPGPESLIVVFAPDAFDDQGAIGWIVDEVRQVRPVTEEEMREAPSDDDHVEGIVEREDADELAVWVRPEDVVDAATDDGDEA